MRVIFLFVWIAYISPGLSQSNQNEENRIILENSKGRCSILSSCPHVYNFLQTQKPRVAERYVRALQNPCGNKKIGTEPVICCAQPATNKYQGDAAPTCRQVTTPKQTFDFSPNILKVPRKLPTLEEGCGRTFTQSPRNTAIDTVNSKKGAWPWFAMIFYVYENTAEFQCAGTLVSARHVISSINCYASDLEEFVRLGSNEKNPNAEGEHVDIQVERATFNGAGSLAILHLERNVDFSSSIVPICLPASPELRRKSYAKHFAFALGFGTYAFDCEKQKQTDILQEQQVSFLDCNSAFNDSSYASYLCPREPACCRDYGSPLVIAEPYTDDESRYYLIGIFTNTKESENFYSNTQFVIDWIKEVLEKKYTIHETVRLLYGGTLKTVAG